MNYVYGILLNVWIVMLEILEMRNKNNVRFRFTYVKKLVIKTKKMNYFGLLKNDDMS